MLCDEKRDYSWKDIDHISSAMAQEMMRTGIRPGDRVALMGQNSVGLICAFWGIQKIAATVFLFNHQYTDPEIKRELDKHSVPYLLLGHTAIPHQKAAFSPGVSVWDLEAVAQAQKTDGYREEEFSVFGEDTPLRLYFLPPEQREKTKRLPFLNSAFFTPQGIWRKTLRRRLRIPVASSPLFFTCLASYPVFTAG